MLDFVTKANKESNKRHRRIRKEKKKSDAMKSKFSFLKHERATSEFLDLTEWNNSDVIVHRDR
jgi:hypothetical protein